MDEPPTTSRHLLRAGLGGFIGAFVVYLIIAGLGGGVDLEDRLTFDQSGELELEGIGIGLALVAGPVIGLPIGTYAALRGRGSRAGATALVAGLLAGLATWLVVGVVRSGPEDPVVAPYLVFCSWFL